MYESHREKLQVDHFCVRLEPTHGEKSLLGDASFQATGS